MQDLISRMVQATFPDKFGDLKLSADRARWTSKNFTANSFEGGVFMNRVTLWKLNSRLHRDLKDLLCVIACGGNFTGSELLVLDLRMKFR